MAPFSGRGKSRVLHADGVPSFEWVEGRLTTRTLKGPFSTAGRVYVLPWHVRFLFQARNTISSKHDLFGQD